MAIFTKFFKTTFAAGASVLLLTGLVMNGHAGQINDPGSEEAQTQIGGYGEAILSDEPGGPNANIKFQRFVIYLNHNFNNWISFRSELEFEHGSELALEQAYLDLNVDRRLIVRTGLIIIPLSVINQFHEPSTFNTVDRPSLDRTLVPSTWREFGAGITGSFNNGLKYQVYVTAGLNSQKFSAKNFIRKGRQGAGALENGAGEGDGQAAIQEAAVVARLDYITPVSGLQLGAAVYRGGTDNRDDGLELNAPVTIVTVNGQYQWGQLELKGQFAWDKIENAERINAANGLSGSNGVAEKAYGVYFTASYNILANFAPETEQSLEPFLFWERVNNHATVPTGTVKNNAYNFNDIRGGIAYRPAYNVIFKLAYSWQKTQEENAKWVPAFRMGIGYNF